MKNSVWAVIFESSVDGDIYTDVNLFTTREKAKKCLEDFKKDIFTSDASKFKCESEEEAREEFEIEETETSFYINDPCDDYYHDVHIYEQEIQ